MPAPRRISARAPARVAPDLHFVEGRVIGVQSHTGRHKMLLAPYPLTLSGIRERFTFSARRCELFDNLQRYITAARALSHPPLLQIISGSFVDDTEEPGDIDLANIVDSIDEEAMPLLFDPDFTKATYEIDAITVCLSDDALGNALALLRIGNYFSSRRDGLHRAYIWVI
ncbi:DUF6932 family protein [Sphingomonas qomolangmaensis]|uniref:Uncharacterized protein n=1 Tax=Sphingomonas qomolangmaensis TaxID=2918765 RepID=A0ABY5LE66_9SPHN|nr:hypothetical protein [Sphingomonas qomolangmaensis]UUL84029.1 hypothetical protein NMP03_07530 [Sphingomonas qomolangmaensis]